MNAKKTNIDFETLKKSIEYFNGLNDKDYDSFIKKFMKEQAFISAYFGEIQSEFTEESFNDIIDYTLILWHTYMQLNGNVPTVSNELIDDLESSFYPKQSELMAELNISDENEYLERLEKFTKQLGEIESEEELVKLSQQNEKEFEVFMSSMNPEYDLETQAVALEFLESELDADEDGEENEFASEVIYHVMLANSCFYHVVNNQ